MNINFTSEHDWITTYTDAIREKMYETEDAFVLEIVQPYVNEVMKKYIPKEVIKRALLTYSQEHSEEMKELMKKYGEEQT